MISTDNKILLLITYKHIPEFCVLDEERHLRFTINESTITATDLGIPTTLFITTTTQFNNRTQNLCDSSSIITNQKSEYNKQLNETLNNQQVITQSQINDSTNTSVYRDTIAKNKKIEETESLRNMTINCTTDNSNVTSCLSNVILITLLNSSTTLNFNSSIVVNKNVSSQSVIDSIMEINITNITTNDHRNVISPCDQTVLPRSIHLPGYNFSNGTWIEVQSNSYDEILTCDRNEVFYQNLQKSLVISKNSYLIPTTTTTTTTTNITSTTASTSNATTTTSTTTTNKY